MVFVQILQIPEVMYSLQWWLSVKIVGPADCRWKSCRNFLDEKVCLK